MTYQYCRLGIVGSGSTTPPNGGGTMPVEGTAVNAINITGRALTYTTTDNRTVMLMLPNAFIDASIDGDNQLIFERVDASMSDPLMLPSMDGITAISVANNTLTYTNSMGNQDVDLPNSFVNADITGSTISFTTADGDDDTNVTVDIPDAISDITIANDILTYTNSMGRTNRSLPNSFVDVAFANDQLAFILADQSEHSAITLGINDRISDLTLSGRELTLVRDGGTDGALELPNAITNAAVSGTTLTLTRTDNTTFNVTLPSSGGGGGGEPMILNFNPTADVAVMEPPTARTWSDWQTINTTNLTSSAIEILVANFLGRFNPVGTSGGDRIWVEFRIVRRRSGQADEVCDSKQVFVRNTSNIAASSVAQEQLIAILSAEAGDTLLTQARIQAQSANAARRLNFVAADQQYTSVTL